MLKQDDIEAAFAEVNRAANELANAISALYTLFGVQFDTEAQKRSEQRVARFEQLQATRKTAAVGTFDAAFSDVLRRDGGA